MRTTIRSVSVLLALVAGAAAPAAAQEPVETRLTLDEAVARAIRVSPTVAQSSGAVRTAESAERSAFGAFLPSLSLSTGASLASTERFNSQTNTSVTGSADSYSAGLNSSLTIFTAGRRGAELRRTAAQTSSAEASLTLQRFNVTLAAKQAFFAVLRADETLAVAQSQLARAQQSLEAAERRIAVGSATQSDRLRSQLELNQARQAVLSAENQRRTAAFALGRLVGADGPVLAQPDSSLAPRPLALSDQELEQLVVAASPSVAAAGATLRANEAGVRVARTQYFPTVTLGAGYDWFNQEASFNDGRLSWSTRLSLNYPLFNGFQREDAVERASVQANTARFQLEDARRAARADLQSALATLELARQQIELSEEAVAVAREDLRVQQERYRLGVATMLDQLTSQTALVQAENDLVAARYEYQIARAELETLAGRAL
jgi:outer membrane protein TolC